VVVGSQSGRRCDNWNPPRKHHFNADAQFLYLVQVPLSLSLSGGCVTALGAGFFLRSDPPPGHFGSGRRPGKKIGSFFWVKFLPLFFGVPRDLPPGLKKKPDQGDDGVGGEVTGLCDGMRSNSRVFSNYESVTWYSSKK